MLEMSTQGGKTRKGNILVSISGIKRKSYSEKKTYGKKKSHPKDSSTKKQCTILKMICSYFKSLSYKDILKIML